MSAATRSKSTWRSSIARNVSRPRFGAGDWYGLSDGSMPCPCAIPAASIAEFRSRSKGAVAALSAQKSVSRVAAPSRSSSSSDAQASSAQIAPPEVPLIPTTRAEASEGSVRRPPSTPAVKAVWLPPP